MAASFGQFATAVLFVSSGIGIIWTAWQLNRDWQRRAAERKAQIENDAKWRTTIEVRQEDHSETLKDHAGRLLNLERDRK